MQSAASETYLPRATKAESPARLAAGGALLAGVTSELGGCELGCWELGCWALGCWALACGGAVSAAAGAARADGNRSGAKITAAAANTID
jgi:hypothetical protein